MDSGGDTLNIVKIKDGFFLGDEMTGSNLEVVMQFKISHIINAAGTEITNSWESIEIKYLTLNWADNKSQNLFDPQDEIANKIMLFIDDAIRTGEGLLVHSVHGQNRACMVILIYFAKKYRWTMDKTLEFLRSKNLEVNIPQHFLSQISAFETRLSRKGEGPISNNWFDMELHLEDDKTDEALISYTYLNGLPRKEISAKRPKNTAKRMKWLDQHRNAGLSSFNISRDLSNIKTVRPVTIHKTLRAKKSILRKKSAPFKGDPMIDRALTPEIRNSSSSMASEKVRKPASRKDSIQENLESFNDINKMMQFNNSSKFNSYDPPFSKAKDAKSYVNKHKDNYVSQAEQKTEKTAPVIVNNNNFTFNFNHSTMDEMKPSYQDYKTRDDYNTRNEVSTNNFFSNVTNPLANSMKRPERRVDPMEQSEQRYKASKYVKEPRRDPRVGESKSETKIKPSYDYLKDRNVDRNLEQGSYKVIDRNYNRGAEKKQPVESADKARVRV